MSKGAGRIEERIAEVFAGTRNRALSIDEIVDNAYALGGRKPTREQRLSATRAAHRTLRRVRETSAEAGNLIAQAHANTSAALGRKRYQDKPDPEYFERLDADPAFTKARKLREYCHRIGSWGFAERVEDKPGMLRWFEDFWRTTTLKRRLWFHPPDCPVEVWAVSMSRTGMAWFPAEITNITDDNVMVRYNGVVARLNRRRLWTGWAWWRGVCFVSSRTGGTAFKLDELWRSQYGATGPAPSSMSLPLAEARALLGVPENYTREDVIKAFRRKAKEAHPDHGGTAERFLKLVEARDRLLSALGMEADEVAAPAYSPSGATITYGTIRSSSARLGSRSQGLLR